MGNANQKSALYDAINADDPAQVTQLLKQVPELINLPNDENGITPLGRAAWRGDVEMIYTLIEHGADVNFAGPQEISPLQWAAQRGKDEAVDFLIQKGAKLDFISKDRLNALDYSILYGAYNTSWKLKNLGLEPKGTDFYVAMAKEKHILYYDYEQMLDHLNRKVPLEECPPFNIPPPEQEFKDPVIDPRETWGQFMKRIIEFEEPPLVEREDLPPELRPENRTLGKLRSMINGLSPYPQPASTASVNAHEENHKEEEIQVEDKGEQKEMEIEMKKSKEHVVEIRPAQVQLRAKPKLSGDHLGTERDDPNPNMSTDALIKMKEERREKNEKEEKQENQEVKILGNQTSDVA